MQREKDRQLEYDDTSNNVHALFPGIDVTPFGRAADPSGPSDNGWSAIPEPTVVKPQSSAPPRRRPGRVRWRALGAGWVAAALLVGGGISVGRTLLAPPTSGDQKSKVASVTGSASFAAAQPQLRAILRTDSTRARQPRARSVRARTTHRRPKVVKQSQPSAPVSTPVAYTSPAPASYQSAPIGETSAYTSSGNPASYTSSGGSATAAAAKSSTSRASAQHAGPTGPVSLIGAGTTPSG